MNSRIMATARKKKTPSYLVKHRKKWQVKLTIPVDVRWAFEHKTTFKRSTGCDITNIKQALIERDRIVLKFKSNVKLHRMGMMGEVTSKSIFDEKFNNRPYPKNYQTEGVYNNLTQPLSKSEVEGWIKERLLNKVKNTPVLRYDFWHNDKTKP